MKKIFCLMVFASFGLVSCDSGADNTPYDPNAKTTTTLLQKKVETFDDASQVTTDYHYDGYKITNLTDSDGGAMVFFYNGNSIVKIETYEDNVLVSNDYFNYNGQGKISFHKHELPSNDYASREEYTYGNDGNASYISFYGTIATQDQPDLPGKLFFSEGELVKKETYLSGSPASSETFAYDQKNAPLRNVTGLADVLTYIGEINGMKRNLLTTSGTVTPRSIEYVYDTSDFPKVSTTTTASDGDVTAVYTYQ